MELLYKPEFDLMALMYMLVLSYFFFAKEKIFAAASKFYGMLLISSAVNTLFDLLSVWTITYAASLPLWVNHVVNLPIFITNVLIPLAFALMALSLANRLPTRRDVRGKLLLHLLLLPCAVGLLMALSTPLTDAIYYFDNGEYMHGPCFIMLYCITVFYIAVGLGVTVRNRKYIDRTQFAVMVIFVIFIMLALIVQTFYPEYLIISAALSLSLTSMYATFQNPDNYVDKNTRLFNREAFIVQTRRIFSRPSDDSAIIGVYVNGIKKLNETLGFSSGDDVLVQMADSLAVMCADTKCLFRTGGSVFSLLVPQSGCSRMIEALEGRFSGTWRTGAGMIHVPFVLCRLDVRDRAANHEEMMKLCEKVADLARIQEDGSVVTLDEEAIRQIARRARIEKLLGEIGTDDRITLCWQPIYAVNSRRVTHVEVLMRMRDEELGNVSPDEFIAVAEQNGDIMRLGLWVLDQTCRFIEEQRVWEHGIRIVAVNLSMRECIQENAAEQVLGILNRYPHAKYYIGLEITETTLATSPQEVIDMMNDLFKEGVQFALDDYGCGWSNCESIIKFPFTAVKMDKGLLWSAMQDPRAMTLYRNSVRMFKEMGMMVVAEGAETGEQVRFLEECGVDYIQGYYFSKPVPQQEFLKLAVLEERE